MAEKAYTVLFLCTGNSARSILAESLLSRLGEGRFRALSAGSDPKGEVHPMTLDLLRSLGHETSGLRSKSWDEFADTVEDDPIDFVFTVCDTAAAEICPVWPGQPITAHWGVPDPAAATGTEAERRQAFSQAARQLRRRIETFINLPVDSLDRMALTAKLEAIGRETDD